MMKVQWPEVELATSWLQHINQYTTMGHPYIPCESKRTAPFYLCNNFVKPRSILIIFGRHTPQ